MHVYVWMSRGINMVTLFRHFATICIVTMDLCLSQSQSLLCSYCRSGFTIQETKWGCVVCWLHSKDNYRQNQQKGTEKVNWYYLSFTLAFNYETGSSWSLTSLPSRFCREYFIGSLQYVINVCDNMAAKAQKSSHILDTCVSWHCNLK